MKTIRIGYQGDEGSNAEEAAHIFADQLETSADTWIEFIPLVTAENVIRALETEKISLGVVAIVNSLGGVVSETRHMLDHAGIGDWRVSAISEHTLPIHHCLFAKEADADVQAIASHEQALKQTRQWRADHYPEAREVETIDTAYAAKMLADGDLSDTVAVICRANAGEKLGLSLVSENIEDGISYTVFHLLQGEGVDDGEGEVQLVVDPDTDEIRPRTVLDNPDTAEVLGSIQN